jgi:formate C-acetyltransferase
VVIYPECGGTTIWPELLTMDARELNPYRISREDIDILDREVFPFWMDDNVREWTRRTFDQPEALRLDERWVLYFQWKNHAVSHTIADLPAVLSRGLLAIAEEARQHEQDAADTDDRAFYEALRIAVDGVVDYGRRIAAAAREMAARLPVDAPRRDELEAMAAAAERAPAHPARSLHEAVQAIWTLFHCLHQENTNAGLSLGRLDVWLQPYLAHDLEAAGPAGREAVVERALELFGALMLKATDHLPLVPDIGNRLFGGSSSDQVITLGGVHADGSDAVCDLTWVALKCTEMLRLRDPNVNARYAPGVSSEAYLRRLCELNLLTRATPSIHNDRAVITALEAQGFTTAHARDWSATGCVEPTSCGRHFGHTGCLMFNLVAALEMALHDGVHPLLGERIGPQTGDPRGFATFEAFLAAFLVQLRALLDRAVEGNDLLGRAHQVLRPTPLLSAVFDGPMQKGRDVIEGGAVYNSTGIANIGLSDVVDSLAAVKTLVFDEQRFTMDALLGALDEDFVGHAPVLAAIHGRVPRFGTDHPLPRGLAAEVVEQIGRHLETKVSYRGGRYVPGYWSMSNHVAFGKLSGALPSGRRRGQPFTPGLTPSALAHAPLTEQLRSVAGLDPRRLPNNLAFNVKVVPGADEPHRVVVDRLAACAAAYADLGGMQLQFNVVSSATLREARRDPASHADLLVRISGYNAYFVDLCADLQEELIDRMEHPL